MLRETRQLGRSLRVDKDGSQDKPDLPESGVVGNVHGRARERLSLRGGYVGVEVKCQPIKGMNWNRKGQDRMLGSVKKQRWALGEKAED